MPSHNSRRASPNEFDESALSEIQTGLNQSLYSIGQSLTWQSIILIAIFIIVLIFLIKTMLSQVRTTKTTYNEPDYDPEVYSVQSAAVPSKRQLDRQSIKDQQLQYLHSDSNETDFTLPVERLKSCEQVIWDPDTFTEFKKRNHVQTMEAHKLHQNSQRYQRLIDKEMQHHFSKKAYKQMQQDRAQQQIERLAKRTDIDPLELSPLSDNRTERIYEETMPLLDLP